MKLDQVYPTGTSPDVFIADVVSLNALYKLENISSRIDMQTHAGNCRR